MDDPNFHGVQVVDPRPNFFSQESVKRMPGYIYLIMMADGVYKVGRTTQDYGNHLKRLKSYPADSQIAYVRRTNGDVVQLEKDIIAKFRDEFGTHPRGREYFVGNDTRMMQVIDGYMTTATIIKKEFSPLRHFMGSEYVQHGPELFCAQQTFVKEFFKFCDDNHLGRHKFNPVSYTDVFKEFGVEVRCDDGVPTIFGVDVYQPPF